MDIDAGWLTEALRRGGSLVEGRVTNVEATPVGEGEGLTGQLARLAVSYDRTRPSMPESFIAKGQTPISELRSFFFAAGLYQVEAGFYQDLAALTPIRTPRCYFNEVDVEAGRIALILEDLAPARAADQTKGATRDDAQTAVRQLARLHAAFWGSAEIESPTWLRGQDDSERIGFLAGAYPFVWPQALARSQGLMGRRLQAVGERLGPHIPRLAALLASSPCTLMHGDFRLDNLMFEDNLGEDGFAAIDWQLVLRGRGAGDLAYFLVGSLAPADRRAWQDGLVRLYCQSLASFGVDGYGVDECDRDMRAAFLLQLASQMLLLSGGDLEADNRMVKVARVILERMSAYCDDTDFSDLLES
jgi:hypothetical protein